MIRGTMMRWRLALRALGAVGVLTAASGLFFACGDPVEETLCIPGDEVFCHCRGGDVDGTKLCLEDGNSFAECISPDGPCPEIGGEVTPLCEAGEEVDCTCDNGDEGTKVCSADGSTFEDCTVAGEPCGSGAGDKLLYSACSDGNECVTGTCASGYCTRSCEIFTDCYDEENELIGDCLAIDGATQCAPYCVTQGDCSAYGEESGCGGAIALDDPEIAFGLCAFWGADLQGMPYGTLCDSETGEILFADQIIVADCNLGAAGVQNYCYFSECTKGCYDDVDCPEMDCTSNGEVLACCESDAECS
jgi:hypothetical protein